jgi:hypothetical protein
MSPTAHSSQPLPVLPAASRAEAARYALLRRLAPSMRHHLVVNLQPIGMIYEVMDRRLRAPQPNFEEVHDGAQKINGFARAALNSCLDVVTWLAPEQNAASTVADGVRECLGLLTTSLAFRGYAVRNDTAPLSGEVHRSAIRNVLTAAMIHLTDRNPAPADLVLSVAALPTAAVFTLTVHPTEGEAGDPPEPSYRALDASDLEALAGAESVELTRDGKRRLTIVIPWVGRS